MKDLLNIISNRICKIIFLIITLIHVSYFSSAQNFERVYGGQYEDNPEIIVHAFNGGYIMGGSTINYSAISNNASDMLLVKTDSLGFMQWSESIKSSIDDELRWIEQAAGNSYLLCGNTYDNVASELNIFRIRMNTTGGIIDQKIYRSSNGERANCIRVTKDGGSVIAGETTLSGTDLQMYLLKTDSTGLVEWSMAYGDSEQESAAYVSQTKDDGFILAGNSRYGLYWSSIYISKTDTAGNLQWAKKYNTQPYLSRCDVSRVLETDDGGYIISGTTNANQPLKYILLMKIDSIGNIAWQYLYGTGGGERNSDILMDAKGYTICGSTADISGYDDLLLMKINNTGSLLWQLSYGVPDSNIIGRSMVKTDLGKYMITAYNDAYGAGGTDFLLLQSDSVNDGSLCNMKTSTLLQDTVTLIGNNSMLSSVVNTTFTPGSFFVAAGVQESLVCSQVLSVNENVLSGGITIFPNPNNGNAVIKINLSNASGCVLEIFDVFGRRIKTFSSDEISVKHEFIFNEEKIKSGMYFCSIRIGERTVSQKMIVSED